MFILLLSIFVFGLLFSKTLNNSTGWMLMVGLAWFAGYFDCKLFFKADQDKKRQFPPDALAVQEELQNAKTSGQTTDAHLFQ